MKRLALLLAVTAGTIGSGRVAQACGGGLVTTTTGTVGQNVQRILVSVRGDKTDIVTQVGVPQTGADYGVLIPVPNQPTLDPTPVPSSDFDALDRRTAPLVLATSEGSDFGCSCGGTKGSDNAPGGGVRVGAPVAIGPVTAVVLDASDGVALATWLSSNGFSVAAADQATVATYAGPGRFFIALRRGDSAPVDGATSVGVHFTLAGDQRSLPLRFARLGAAATVSFTVFVAASGTAAPGAPFQTLTLDDLDAALLRNDGYPSAVAAAVSAHDQRAFVIEGSAHGTAVTAVTPGDIGRLAGLIDGNQEVTRLSTILPAAALTSDVTFDGTFSGAPPHARYVRASPSDLPKNDPKTASAGLLAVALVLAGLRRRARR